MSHPIVIVGTGAFAHTHAKAISRNPRLALAGFVGSRPESANDIAIAYETKAYGGLAQALIDDTVAGVIIATPHDSHAAIGADALAAGKAVLIEKPLAATLNDCDHLIAAEAKGPGRGMVGHLMRWSPAHVQARDLIVSGAIGTPVSAEGRRYINWQAGQRRAWQKSAAAGGGMWQIQGVHVIDQLTWLIGTRADAVVGLSQTRFHAEQGADDIGSALLAFGQVSGQINIAGTRGCSQPQVYAEIVGTEGAIRVSHRGMLDIDTGGGWRSVLKPIRGDHWEAMLDAELSAFADLIEAGEVMTDFGYGRYIASVVDAIRRSQHNRCWEAVQ